MTEKTKQGTRTQDPPDDDGGGTGQKTGSRLVDLKGPSRAVGDGDGDGGGTGQKTGKRSHGT